MSATDHLDSRVAGALQRAKPLPADVEVLLAQVEAALADTERELAQANAQALDPTSTSAVIASARGVTFDAQFRLQRLVVARERLVEKHAAALARVEREAREREHAEISAERDAVTERLLEVYQRAAGEIAGVLAEAVQSTRRVAAWNASGVGPWIGEPPQFLRAVRLPPERVGEAAFWPPLERLDVAGMIPAEMAKREAAVAAEALEATQMASRLEEANRLARGARRRVLAGSW